MVRSATLAEGVSEKRQDVMLQRSITPPSSFGSTIRSRITRRLSIVDHMAVEVDVAGL
jgi:hypothetical protein